MHIELGACTRFLLYTTLNTRNTLRALCFIVPHLNEDKESSWHRTLRIMKLLAWTGLQLWQRLSSQSDRIASWQGCLPQTLFLWKIHDRVMFQRRNVNYSGAVAFMLPAGWTWIFYFILLPLLSNYNMCTMRLAEPRISAR